MATSNCTVNGINYFTSSNTSGTWGSSSWFSSTASINNKPCFGKFYYNGVYKNRALVLKITTPTYPSNSHTRTLNITVGLRRTSKGSDNWHCAISTTAPSFSTTSSAQIPTTWVTSWNSISTESAWKTISFNTSSFNFQSNTVYYLWFYSDTPTGNSTTGFFGNNYGSLPVITVTSSYSTQTSNNTYAKPTNPELYGYSGYYGGAKIEIDTNTSYPNCYVGTSSTGTFWKKTLKTASDGKQYFTVDADTTTTTSSKTYYIVRAVSSVTASSISAPSTAYQTTYACPRYACQVYCHSQSPIVFRNVNGPSIPSFDKMTVLGLSSTEDGTSPELAYSWSSNGSKLNGKTFYMIYKGTKTSTYYCGGPTSHTNSITTIYYGKDDYLTEISGSTSSNTFACESDSSYSLIGWTGIIDNIDPEYIDINSATEDEEYVYGVYEKVNFVGSTWGGTIYRGTDNPYYWEADDVYSRAYICGTGQSHIPEGSLSHVYRYDTSFDGTDSTGLEWRYLGINGDPNSSTILYSDIENAIFTGKIPDPAYCVYSQTQSMTYYPQNGGSSNTASTTNYLYGTGQSTSNRPTEPSLTKTNWVVSGWGTSTSDTTSDSWNTLWDNGIRTVYAIWTPDNSVKFGNSSWKNVEMYYGINGVWKPVVVRMGVNGEWKGGSKIITFTVGGSVSQAERGMTWFDYCNSSYNTIGFMCSGKDVTVLAASGFPIELANGKIQYGSDLIIANGNYSVVVSSPNQ